MTVEERARKVVRRVFPLKVAIGPVGVDFADAADADVFESRVFYAIRDALAAERAQEREKEREACARIADEWDKDFCDSYCTGGCGSCAGFAAQREIAAAIRGRTA